VGSNTGGDHRQLSPKSNLVNAHENEKSPKDKQVKRAKFKLNLKNLLSREETIRTSTEGMKVASSLQRQSQLN